MAAIKKIKEIVSALALPFSHIMLGFRRKCFDSQQYWVQRYRTGGDSGPGSRNVLAEFKAKILNDFVKKHEIQTIIEFGCGDGSQLKLAGYPQYLGFDISRDAIALCKMIFRNDPTKAFKLMHEHQGEKAELALSLDVVYHLTEDRTYDAYMRRLFNASTAYVIIYSDDSDDNSKNDCLHIRHRKFSNWIAQNAPDWKLVEQIPNPYTVRNNDIARESWSDFYIYQKLRG